MPAIATAFEVKLPVFVGPLELLLQMVQARKLDVSSVSLAAITSDYVSHVRGMQGVPANELAAFILVAAQLVAAKSRLLLPSARGEERDQEPDGEELLRRVQAYEQFKESAERLAERLDRELASYTPLVPQPARPPSTIEVGLPGVTRLRDLVENLAHRGRGSVATIPAVVARAWVEIDTCIEILRVHAADRDELTFAAILGEPASPDTVVGLFLALLHVWKWGEFEVTQDRPYGDIRIRRVSISQTLPVDGPAI